MCRNHGGVQAYSIGATRSTACSTCEIITVLESKMQLLRETAIGGNRRRRSDRFDMAGNDAQSSARDALPLSPLARWHGLLVSAS